MSLPADERRVLEALKGAPRMLVQRLAAIADRSGLSPVTTRRVLKSLEARTPPLVLGTDDEGEPLVDVGLEIRFWTISVAGQEALEEG